MIIRDSNKEELQLFKEFEERDDTNSFINSYSLEEHKLQFEKLDIIYKTIVADEEIIGFILLRLDDDGESVEFRRIVIDKKGKGYGKEAVKWLDNICIKELERKRIWLDVYDFNKRGIHIYESCGYKFMRSKEENGKTLKIYEKNL